MREHKNELDGLLLWKRTSEIVGLACLTNHDGIDRCLNCMARSFCKPIKLKHLIKISGMTRRGFVKAFNRHVGVNPGTVLRYIRIEYAKRVLIERDLTLKKIAKRCGFRSANTFSVAFQRDTGMSPKKFQTHYWLTTSYHLQQSNIQPVIADRLLSPPPDGNGPVRHFGPPR